LSWCSTLVNCWEEYFSTSRMLSLGFEETAFPPEASSADDNLV
jgi:hypothetical protein